MGLTTRRPKKPGMGLRIMRYRAELIGGSLSVQAAAAGGTIVQCNVHSPKGNTLVQT